MADTGPQGRQPTSGVEPGDATLASYEAAAQRYREQEHRGPEVTAFLDRIADLVPGGEILELGSGPGVDASYLEGRGLRVVRSDAASAFVNMMRADGHDARLLDVRRDELGGQYDAVIALAMLLHLTREEFRDALGRAWRAIVPGGVLAFTLKEGDGEAWSDAKLGVPRHFTYWRETEIRTALDVSRGTLLSIDHVAGRTEPWLFVLARRPQDLPLAGPPDREIAVPAAIMRLAGDAAVQVVWENQVGGLTFEVSGDPERRFVKWAPHGSGLDLSAEAERMVWAGPFTPIPDVLDLGHDDAGSWLVTRALPGETAVSERWRGSPAIAVAAIGEGLRAFHDALPVASCRFSWSAEERVADVERRRALGRLDPVSWHPEHQGLAVEEAVRLLRQIPSDDQVVVCHGDACAPNTLVGVDGRWSGHVDLGSMGVADRWADLAIATWSADWNYGPGWEDRLLAAYGTAPDPERTRYYRLLWDLGP